MELKLYKRPDNKTGTKNKLRIQGYIPAVIYGKGLSSESIYIAKDEYEAALRQIDPGKLSTTVFVLVDEKKKYKAIIKEAQYHVTNYKVQHIDFEILQDNVKVNVHVPINLSNVDICPGVKLGGTLRQVIRKIKVNCLPKDMPKEFVIDVAKMNLMDAIRLSHLQMPQGVKPLAQLQEVAVTVAKR